VLPLLELEQREHQEVAIGMHDAKCLHDHCSWGAVEDGFCPDIEVECYAVD